MAVQGIRATDGSLNVTVRDGTVYTGNQNPDGSINVVLSDGLTVKGATHPSGGWWVTNAPAGYHALRAPDGSLYVSTSPYANGGQHVTVVSGSL